MHKADIIVINVIGIGYILRYANKVKKDPKRSVVYEDDEYWRQAGAQVEEQVSRQATMMAFQSQR
ncbi:MAG: hypothetical protein ABIJ04_04220 [Bacteroidota bacterium]